MKPKEQKKSEVNVFIMLATLPDAKQRQLLGLPPLPEKRLKTGKKKKEKKS